MAIRPICLGIRPVRDHTDRDLSWSKGLSPLPGLSEFLIHRSNEGQDLVSPHFFYGAGNKMLWQKLPGLAHLREKVFDIGSDDTLVLLVGLGEDETKGDAPLAQLVDKFQIDLLRRMPAIDKDEDADEVLPFAQIIFDHLFPLFTLVLGDFGEAITREVDDIPGIVDVEMVDQLRLTGRTGGLGQLIAVAKHIDQ